MSSIGTSKGILEIGKFAFYVSIPIDLMYTLANNSENMKNSSRRYSFSSVGAMKLGSISLFTSLYEFMNEAMAFEVWLDTRPVIAPNTRILPLVSQAFEVWLDTRPVIAPNTRILPLVSRAFEIQEGTRLVYNILSCF
ncbi:hypothetical protein CK203_107251 [Vitis vinifera]|uniref:Uncharacterized protein n=1 Tax=Vitis vinifera TaxID=29760 RepID=A0A438BNA1_VITVI|nr:hypothetical protein CK203_107251 [Vitis vinifera]